MRFGSLDIRCFVVVAVAVAVAVAAAPVLGAAAAAGMAALADAADATFAMQRHWWSECQDQASN